MRRLTILLLLTLTAHRAVADEAQASSGEDASAKAPTCGDGVVEGDEACDDGNTRNYDGCDAACQIEPLWGCGDTLLGNATVCDDEGEACLPACAVDSFAKT